MTVRRYRPTIVVNLLDGKATLSGLFADGSLPALHHMQVDPGSVTPIRTGLGMKVPPGWTGLVMPETRLAVDHMVTMINAPEIVDSTHWGEIVVRLTNHGRRPFGVWPGLTVARFIVVPEAEPLYELYGAEKEPS